MLDFMSKKAFANKTPMSELSPERIAKLSLLISGEWGDFFEEGIAESVCNDDARLASIATSLRDSAACEFLESWARVLDSAGSIFDLAGPGAAELVSSSLAEASPRLRRAERAAGARLGSLDSAFEPRTAALLAEVEAMAAGSVRALLGRAWVGGLRIARLAARLRASATRRLRSRAILKSLLARAEAEPLLSGRLEALALRAARFVFQVVKMFRDSVNARMRKLEAGLEKFELKLPVFLELIASQFRAKTLMRLDGSMDNMGFFQNVPQDLRIRFVAFVARNLDKNFELDEQGDKVLELNLPIDDEYIQDTFLPLADMSDSECEDLEVEERESDPKKSGGTPQSLAEKSPLRQSQTEADRESLRRSQSQTDRERLGKSKDTPGKIEVKSSEDRTESEPFRSSFRHSASAKEKASQRHVDSPMPRGDELLPFMPAMTDEENPLSVLKPDVEAINPSSLRASMKMGPFVPEDPTKGDPAEGEKEKEESKPANLRASFAGTWNFTKEVVETSNNPNKLFPKTLASVKHAGVGGGVAPGGVLGASSDALGGLCFDLLFSDKKATELAREHAVAVTGASLSTVLAAAAPGLGTAMLVALGLRRLAAIFFSSELPISTRLANFLSAAYAGAAAMTAHVVVSLLLGALSPGSAWMGVLAAVIAGFTAAAVAHAFAQLLKTKIVMDELAFHFLISKPPGKRLLFKDFASDKASDPFSADFFSLLTAFLRAPAPDDVLWFATRLVSRRHELNNFLSDLLCGSELVARIQKKKEISQALALEIALNLFAYVVLGLFFAMFDGFSDEENGTFEAQKKALEEFALGFKDEVKFLEFGSLAIRAFISSIQEKVLILPQ